MKKNIKHSFKHKDPEKEVTEKVTSIKSSGQNTNKSNELELKDLKRTGILVSLFVVIVIILYFVQIKTALLNPVLKIFGL